MITAPTLETSRPASASDDLSVRPARTPRGVRNHLRSAALLLCVVAVIFPVAWALLTSLRPVPEVYDVNLWPREPTLENYRYVMDRMNMPRLLLNTTLMSLAVAAAKLAAALMLTYAVSRFAFRGRKVVLAAVVATIVIPGQVLVVPNFMLAADLGLVGTFAGLVLPPAAASAYAVLLLQHYLNGFPRSLYDTSDLAGASHGEVLWRVVVPNLRPVLAALFVLLFIDSWNDYLWPLLVTRNSEWATVQVGLRTLTSQDGGTVWGVFMAASCLASVPVLLIYLFARRRITGAFIEGQHGA